MNERVDRATPRTYLPGREIGGYQIATRLGSGAMGTVYRAYDGGGNLVAIKFLHAHLDQHPSGRERLRREASALQRLRHPAVAQILDVELDAAEAFIVTELIDGPTLEDEIISHGPLDPWDLYELADQLATALNAVHAAGVIHRDLKPSNVLIAARGPVLIDFGIAHGLDDPRVTLAGVVMGTPGYLSPELLDGAQPSAATDWWGWTAMLAYAATGRAPFGVRPTELVLARSHSGSADLCGLGPMTSDALAGGLRADPGLRQAAHEIVCALRRAAVEGDPVPPPIIVGPSTAPTQVVPPVRTAQPPELPASQRTVHDGRTALMPMWSSTTAGYGDPDHAEEPETAHPNPGRSAPAPARPWLSIVLAIPMILLSCLFPTVVAMTCLALSVLARTLAAAVRAHQARQARQGKVRAESLRIAIAIPWYSIGGVVAAVPAFLLSSLTAIAIVLASAALGLMTEPRVEALVLALAGAAVVLVTWRGPVTAAARFGARTALARLVPGRGATIVVTLVVAIIAVLLGEHVIDGPVVRWWPVSGEPSL